MLNSVGHFPVALFPSELYDLPLARVFLTSGGLGVSLNPLQLLAC